MNKFKFACLAILMNTVCSVFAGGLLTNTNQNILFLRNPARDGAIGIDGVYSNPAGVAFLTNGFHLSLNLQNAHQTRTILTGYGDLFKYNVNRPASADNNYVHQFKGVADAPVIPSVQAAYVRDKWSVQFGFAITGGGGKCEFEDGLGSFEGVVASIPASLLAAGINNSLAAMGTQLTGGYGYEPFMRGRQYYYGFTLGATYKVTDNLSVYGGARMLYGTSNYYGYVKNISLQQSIGGLPSMVSAPAFFNKLASTLTEAAGRYDALGMTEEAAAARAQAAQMNGYSQMTEDIELNCDQTGWGIAPIIGIDYKLGKLNLAAKYEFKTRMRLKNKSANSLSASNIAMLDKFKDGKIVAEDSPALLTLGAQYEILPSLRVMAGYHHYFDTDTRQYTGDKLGNSNEYLAGAEYDINKYVQISAGLQKTSYDFEDSFMNDISFNVSSYSFGFGVGVNVTPKVKINAAYFQTNYEDYDKTETSGNMTVSNSFTRTNRVLGLGVDLTL
ncbi:MAG: OmpP1/FadL family transporter [Prevotella sp.]